MSTVRPGGECGFPARRSRPGGPSATSMAVDTNHRALQGDSGRGFYQMIIQSGGQSTTHRAVGTGLSMGSSAGQHRSLCNLDNCLFAFALM